MSKIDLDEIEASLAYLEEWQKLIKELRAARECVEYLRVVAGHVRGSNRLDGIPYTELECLAKYDEATK